MASPRTLPRACGRTILGAMTSSITLTLNGEVREFDGPADGPLSVAAMLVVLGLDTKKVAIERNEEIVPRSSYAETWLASGDALEIVHFIGGG
jgi:sulfur carrier protein